MGKMQEFLGWLAGDGGGSSGKPVKTTYSSSKGRRGAQSEQARSRQMQFKLRLQVKRMQKQQKKLEFQADKSRKKAMDLKRNGDEAGARMYAAEMLKYRKMGASMVRFVTNLQAMQFKLEQVTEAHKMADMFSSIDASLQGMKETVSVPELQSTLDSINSTITELDASLEVTQDGLELTTDAQVSDKEVSDALNEIDTGLAMEGMDLPSAGISEEEDEKLKEYKARIDSLRG